MSVTIMAAVAHGSVIGKDGSIPWRLPADMRRFREVTMGHVLVMGRRTYDSIGRALPGRTTIVVTRDPDWPHRHRPAGLLVATDLPSALRQADGLGGETFIQGGASLYAEALDIADRLLITWVDAHPEGDTFFPEVDWQRWVEVATEPFEGGRWTTYQRRPTPPENQ